MYDSYNAEVAHTHNIRQLQCLRRDELSDDPDGEGGSGNGNGGGRVLTVTPTV